MSPEEETERAERFAKFAIEAFARLSGADNPGEAMLDLALSQARVEFAYWHGDAPPKHVWPERINGGG